MANALLEIENRGKDAAGWWATYCDGSFCLEKKPYRAEKLISKEVFPPAEAGVPLSVAMHTRLSTQGTHLVNNNNHPVVVGRVRVVHNGMISNDKQFKTSEYGFDSYPEVDTSAIASLLNHEVDEPTELEKIGEALADLWGSFAIGVQWAQTPELTVIAKGPGSPLYIAESPHATFWGSTAGVVDKMVDRLGLSDAIKHRGHAKEGAIFLIKDGSIIEQEEFAYTPLPTRTTLTSAYSGTSIAENEKRNKELLRWSEAWNCVAVLGSEARPHTNSRYQSGGQLMPLSLRDSLYWESGVTSEYDPVDPELPKDIRFFAADARAVFVWRPKESIELDSSYTRFFVIYEIDGQGREIEVVVNNYARVLDIYFYDNINESVEDKWIPIENDQEEAEAPKSGDNDDDYERDRWKEQNDEELRRLARTRIQSYVKGQIKEKFISYKHHITIVLPKSENRECAAHKTLVTDHYTIFGCPFAAEITLLHAAKLKSVADAYREAKAAEERGEPICDHDWYAYSWQHHNGKRYPQSFYCANRGCEAHFDKGVYKGELMKKEARL